MALLKRFFASALAICCTIFLVTSCDTKKDFSPAPTAKDSFSKPNKNPYVNYDQSPMDMSYYPVDYPILKMSHSDSLPLIARVIYSRPHKNNRVIFSNDSTSVCQYGREWRLGANEATEIDFFKNVTIAGKNINAGTYVLYCIPEYDSWTIVLNSNLHTWGLHMDPSKDILRTQIPVQVQSPILEDFTIVFQDAVDGANLVMGWDNVKTVLPIVFSK